MTAVAHLVEYVEHFQRRVVQDALTEATVGYWLGRADAFDHALPRPGDYLGGGVIGSTGYYPAPPGSEPSYWFPGPRPDDGLRPGVACIPQSAADLEAQRIRIAETAQACRHRAAVVVMGGE